MYLVSKIWLKKYKDYILYSDVKKNNKPSDDQEFGSNPPGPITNVEDLCEPDTGVNLMGTGTVEQFETNYVDRYLLKDVRERY